MPQGIRSSDGFPITPFLIQDSSKFSYQVSGKINPDAEQTFSPAQLLALQNRLNMGGVGGEHPPFAQPK